MFKASERFYSNDSYDPCNFCDPYDSCYPHNPYKLHESPDPPDPPDPHTPGDTQACCFDHKPVNLLR